MEKRNTYVWPVAGLFALAALVLAITYASAQRPGLGGMGGSGFGMFGMPGRFAVAHGSDKAVLILDTMTGHVYSVGTGDFKKASDLPKIEFGFPGGAGDGRPVREARDPVRDRVPSSERRDAIREARDPIRDPAREFRDPPLREAKDTRPPVRDRDPIRDRDPVRDGLKDTKTPPRDTGLIKDRDPKKGGKDSVPPPIRPSDIDKTDPKRITDR